ncbi:DNA glycosylase superfamily protein [Striga asiatica]|uniref:DNA glycosylase superfamily protein n=1 Tax=Striga asiatica TaxID=4170 RepID=A0A5A7PVC7_STRAF|nr:DNA glycosylase superfamily protein [Striga asiatica]
MEAQTDMATDLLHRTFSWCERCKVDLHSVATVENFIEEFAWKSRQVRVYAIKCKHQNTLSFKILPNGQGDNGVAHEPSTNSHCRELLNLLCQDARQSSRTHDQSPRRRREPLLPEFERKEQAPHRNFAPSLVRYQP